MSDTLNPLNPLNPIQPWYQHYLAYDEDSLVTYANAGLFRRATKDLDNDKIQLITADSDKICFDNDGQTVTLTADGLAKASCTCPTHSACKHIVASVLKTQQLLNTTTELSNNPTAETAEPPTNLTTTPATDSHSSPDILAEILAIDVDKLAKKIGKAQTQKALTFAKLYPITLADIHLEKRTAKTRIATIDEDIRYLVGAGFDGMLSNFDVDKLAWHWYVLSEIQRLHGKLSPLRQRAEREQQQQIANQQQLTESSKTLVASVEQTLSEFVEHGLANLDNLSAKRLFMLSISARSDELYRLATQLRQLSGFLNRWLNQDETLSERQLLISMAHIFAYLQQLKSAKNETFTTLKGQLRQSYEHDDSQLTLYPLGARWWRTLGGARGLTLYFWEIHQQQAIEVTSARAVNQDPNFDSHSAWQNSLWVLSPAQLMSHVSLLSEPRFNPQGQLASSGSTAKVQGDLDENYIQALTTIAVDDLQQLNEQTHENNPLATDTPFNDRQIRLLAIDNADKLIIDEVAQCVWWQVYDKQGNLLRLKLNWQDYQSDTVRKIKQLEQLDMRKIRLILVYQTLDGNAVSLEPISLVIERSLQLNHQTTQSPATGFQLFNLDFDHAPRLGQHKSSLKELITGRITQLLNQKKQRQQIYQLKTHLTLSETLCEPILQVMESAVGVGRLRLSDSQQHTLRQQASLATDVGMNLLADNLYMLLQQAQAKNIAIAIFKIVYLCDLYLRLQLNFPIQIKEEQNAN